jgi:hypothetical protein
MVWRALIIIAPTTNEGRAMDIDVAGISAAWKGMLSHDPDAGGARRVREGMPGTPRRTRPEAGALAP